MKWITNIKPPIWALIASTACLVYGALHGNVLACALAAVLITTFGRQIWLSWRNTSLQKPRRGVPELSKPESEKKTVPSAAATTPRDYIRNMIDQGRYALLLRNEVIGNIGQDNGKVALDELKSMMSHILAGEVHARRSPVDAALATGGKTDPVHVEDFYLDRFAVTNEEFKRFVDDQGYANDEFWSEEIRTARNEFVDQTGQPGPRFWHEGTYALGESDHPVVGVSWYEAEAYARWQGKRLPSDAEWTKAASSPKSGSNLPSHQRKYPWGATLEEGRANLWSTGIGTTVPVDEFEDGDNVCQVRQLVGNVWEWAADNFPGAHDNTSWHTGDKTFKSLRGGAFDTYFEHHVSCPAKSADEPLARKHNVGFRCALSTADVTPVVGGNL